MGSLRDILAGTRGLIFPVLIVTAILVIVAPLPPVLMDMLLACNVTIGVLILLTTIYVAKPLEFSVFPAILLGTTLVRLVLNVASTRLILSRGATDGTNAAGGVIEAFGSFVTSGNLAVGVILFVILIAIQFLVITKGATRISEVAARFALDGMPGKQMAIDADLNAGLITSEQAKSRREEITSQADFYGSMDGASKFVRGDAIASIVITLINIAGGFYVGMVENGMNASDAARVFTTLTIGDGLVTQVPGFLISLAAALVVTRTSSASNLPQDVVGQMFRHPEAMFLAASFLVALSLTGLPTMPMLTLGAGCAVVGVSLRRSNSQKVVEQAKQERQQEQAQRPEPKPEENLLVDPLELELGVGLLKLADPSSGGDLLDRVVRIRNKIAQELGMILPKVRIRDNIRLDQRTYRIKLRDVPIAKGEAYADARLAIDTGAASGSLPGVETTEPAFGRPAHWIELSAVERAELYGYQVVEPSAVLITHLTEIVRDHAAEILTRQHVHQLLDNLKEHSPNVVEELIPDQLKVSQVHQILANLLKERVPIRDLETILETLGDFADRTKDLGILTEYVRNALARTICQQYRDRDNVLHCVTLDPGLEDTLSKGFEFGEAGLAIKLPPNVVDQTVKQLADSLSALTSAGHPAVVVCGPQVRAGLKQITRSSLSKLAVLSLNEITRDTNVEVHGSVPDVRG
ncbi:flagellar biosynthesis protein FlhA [Stratiformator vulcanicus]|uniref:Flagellar biosynthesis protein FlhA n=1 Tax=Stratiformator vulcanicus TaxID=2527980 RepID=A0A517QVU0_9PLAN|nr:flagellar biosynthesis protein FlhA [Stratiformator vulcanicus]QDT35704.1 Flagellar biosynthesis protein FlhA [Stratiformator vulcanicus]